MAGLHREEAILGEQHGHLQGWRKGLDVTDCWHLNPRFVTLRTVGKKIILFKPPSLQYLLGQSAKTMAEGKRRCLFFKEKSS